MEKNAGPAQANKPVNSDGFEFLSGGVQQMGNSRKVLVEDPEKFMMDPAPVQSLVKVMVEKTWFDGQKCLQSAN